MRSRRTGDERLGPARGPEARARGPEARAGPGRQTSGFEPRVVLPCPPGGARTTSPRPVGAACRAVTATYPAHACESLSGAAEVVTNRRPVGRRVEQTGLSSPFGSRRRRQGRAPRPAPKSDRQRPAPQPGRAGLLVGGEVLGSDLIEEVFELLDHLFGVLDFVLELDRGLGDDLVGGEDRGPRADG